MICSKSLICLFVGVLHYLFCSIGKLYWSRRGQWYFLSVPTLHSTFYSNKSFLFYWLTLQKLCSCFCLLFAFKRSPNLSSCRRRYYLLCIIKVIFRFFFKHTQPIHITVIICSQSIWCEKIACIYSLCCAM